MYLVVFCLYTAHFCIWLLALYTAFFNAVPVSLLSCFLIFYVFCLFACVVLSCSVLISQGHHRLEINEMSVFSSEGYNRLPEYFACEDLQSEH